MHVFCKTDMKTSEQFMFHVKQIFKTFVQVYKRILKMYSDYSKYYGLIQRKKAQIFVTKKIISDGTNCLDFLQVLIFLETDIKPSVQITEEQ